MTTWGSRVVSTNPRTQDEEKFKDDSGATALQAYHSFPQTV